MHVGKFFFFFTRLCKMNEIKIWGKCGLLCSPWREQNLYKGLVLHIYFVIVAMQIKNECTFLLCNNLERCQGTCIFLCHSVSII